jgi:8-oxo-dGTP pyrophosphatase MutT (NUDIX family)
MVRKIFINGKPLFLVNEITRDIDEYLHHEETVFIDEFNSHTLKAMIHEMEAPQIRAGVFQHHDVEAVLNAFKKKLTLIMAAGCLVHTSHDQVLLIFRHGKWDLPKGKLDENEDLASCAIRETKEETGLVHLKLERPLFPTWHTYHQDGKHIIKETHWFLVKGEQQHAFIPQVAEGIEKCEWVKTDQLASYLENTYPLIIDMVKAGIEMLHEVKNV